MAYPTLPWMDDGSDESRDGGIIVDQAEDGTTHTRSSWVADARRFRAVHLLTQSDRDTLLAFYASNRTATFAVTIPGSGETIDARFAAAPQGADLKRPKYGLRYRVAVDLVEVA